IIHAFDDPDHAILALPAARRYADIAPEAHHARHMPSHIFLQLGMWPEAAASNESAWESSDNWMKRKNLSLSVRDYHSLQWLQYAYLQQGRYAKAEQLVKLMKKVMAESTYDNKLRPDYYENNYANMAAAFVVETERWELANELFPPTNPSNPSNPSSSETVTSGSHAGHSAPQTTNTTRYSNASRTLPPFIRALSAAIRGSKEVEAGLSGIRELEVAAVAASMRKEHEQAIELMKKATAQEEQTGPPLGPPALIKPTHELFGEILLRAGKPAEAATQFGVALLRQPNRARSLLGAARAAAQSGDNATAAANYSKLLEQWNQADEGLPELREAREFLKRDK
ncbi:MAG TPA: hypothetical protein VGW58_04840, partial [Pyrinomonadaceae bacterium]|nr:hypothetical protein [Pyrinomonadaceae bacterium]